jgi:hypothetical protein
VVKWSIRDAVLLIQPMCTPGVLAGGQYGRNGTASRD